MATSNPTLDPRWAAVAERRQEADGTFVYSVITTGVYCRPSCSSRTARPEHVRFFEAPEEAERAGFRPCLRCRPDQSSPKEQQVAVITELCRYIEASEQPPTLEQLARRAGWSRYHLQRTFKAIAGVTPRGYAAAVRSDKVRRELKTGDSVTEAIYQSGYNSSGRFYEASDQMLGMTPSRYRAGGADTDIHFAVGECSLGSILVARSAKGVCAIYLGDDPDVLIRILEDQFPAANLLAGDRDFEQLVARVVGFVEAPEQGLNLPLDIRGTAFQQRVWEVLRQIPVGQTLSYAEVAERLGKPSAVRAVAGACAANRLAVVIPCHRVVRSDGSLSGYRWGVERKKMLLERES